MTRKSPPEGRQQNSGIHALLYFPFADVPLRPRVPTHKSGRYAACVVCAAQRAFSRTPRRGSLRSEEAKIVRFLPIDADLVRVGADDVGSCGAARARGELCALGLRGGPGAEEHGGLWEWGWRGRGRGRGLRLRLRIELLRRGDCSAGLQEGSRWGLIT